MEIGKLKHGIASWTCLRNSWIFSLLSTYFPGEKKVSTQGGIKIVMRKTYYILNIYLLRN